MRPVKVDGPKVTIAAGLVLAEFDIDTGSCMRACYPKQITSVHVPNADSQSGVTTKPVNLELKLYEQYFANHMLPDGAEKLTVGRTVFVVNRPKLPAYLRLPVYRFAAPEDAASVPPAAQSWTRLLPSTSTDAFTPELLLLDTQTGEVTFRQHGQPLAEPSLIAIEDYITLSATPAALTSFEQKLIQMTAAAPTDPGTTRRDNPAAGLMASPSFVFVTVNREAESTAAPHGFFIGNAQYRTFLEALTQALAPRSQPTPEPDPMPAAEAAATAVPHDADQAADHDASATEVEPAPGDVQATSEHNASSSSSNSSSAHNDDGAPHAELVAIESDPATGEPAEEGDENKASWSDAPPAVPRRNPFAEEYSSPLHAGDGQDGQIAATSVTSHGSLGDVTSTASGTMQLVLPDGGASTTSGTNALASETDRLAAGETHSGGGLVPSVVFGDGCTLYGLCAVVSKRDSAVRRGGITKSVALLGPSLAWLDAFFPILVEAARYCCDIRGSDTDAVQQQTQVLKMCYDTISKAAPVVTAGLTRTSQLATEVSKFATYSSDNRQLYAEVRETPFGTQHKLKIPLSPGSHDIRFSRYSLEGMIEAFGPAFMHIVQGILTEKKIVVLSRQGISTDVCEATLSIGLIGNLIDPQFMEKKVFPYTSINAVDSFLHVPGYVLGTLNPIFENERHFRWDMLCDLDARTVVFSGAEKKRGTTATLAANWSAATAEFASAVGVGEDPSFKGVSTHAARLFKVLSSAVYRMRALRLPPPERNRRLRLMLEEHMHIVTTMLFVVDGDTNLPAPLQALRNDPSLAKLRPQMAMTSFADAPLTGVMYPAEPPELFLATVALRRCREANAVTVQRLLQNILTLLSPSDERVLMMLRRMPVALSGLDPVGYQLLHPAPGVQTAAFALFKRIETVPLGKAAISAMSNFLVMVYENMVLREKQRAYYTAV